MRVTVHPDLDYAELDWLRSEAKEQGTTPVALLRQAADAGIATYMSGFDAAVAAAERARLKITRLDGEPKTMPREEVFSPDRRLQHVDGSIFVTRVSRTVRVAFHLEFADGTWAAYETSLSQLARVVGSILEDYPHAAPPDWGP
jgi:hypothetical protein